MSKTSKTFQDTIKAYLDQRAATDELFAKSYAKEGKSIEQCCDYIVSEVQKMKVNGLSDDEVYSLAVHYFDEDNLGDIKCSAAKVVVNHVVELTEEEKAQAKLDAMKRIEKEEYERLQAEREETNLVAKKQTAKKPASTPAPAPTSTSPSLFDDIDE
ncbi:MAG: PcfK-like family protein [Bacteroides sp.]|nr:PcfK-like family protein [Bacteroides sp.]